MLLANRICFNRNDKEILKDISFSISPKKIIHIAGKNGSGKTTLLKIICNILDPNDGEIIWNGKNTKKNIYEFYKNVTFIMDNQTSSNSLTVNDNIFFWHKIFNSKINKKEINSVLELLSLDKYKDTQINQLSFGEIKKLELLRLIIEQKKLWILDEPFIGLDKSSVQLITQTITNHANLNGMVIFTSHSRHEIPNLEIFNMENNA